MRSRKPEKLDIRIERRGRAVIVRLAGSAAMTETDRLQKCLVDLAAEEFPLTVLDLHDLSFIGSAGLAAIVYGHLKNRHHGGQIRLAALQAKVLEIFEKTRLTKLFDVYASTDEAMGQ